MLRITVVDSSNWVVWLRVEGRLTGRSVEELRRSCDLHALGEGRSLIIDVADLSFADADGIDLLKNLRSQNVALLNLVPFLALQVRDAKGGNLPPRNKGVAREES